MELCVVIRDMFKEFYDAKLKKYLKRTTYTISYCGKKPCHSFVLLDIVNKIRVEGRVL